MDYRRFNKHHNDTIVVRLDPGDEIVECMLALAKRENIALAEISGLGAVDEFTAGVFRLAEKKFQPNHFEGEFEITSLVGTLSTMNGEPYCHLHMSAGDVNGHVYGGHLSRARISATGEIVVRIIEGKVDRKFNEEIGLNLFDF